MREAAAMTAALLLAAGPAAGAAAEHPVLELRQYKIVPGQRDKMIALFEAKFVESQEAEGMRLEGLFRDANDPNRFTWLRSFKGMPQRERGLSAFYLGPIWQAKRGQANPLLADNDNVLLLRPAAAGTGFPQRPGPPPAAGTVRGGLVVATIHYLWKAPDEGFSGFFLRRLAPELTAAGLPVLGAYVAEEQPNNFPRLPVRQGEKVFVWFTRADDETAYRAAMARLRARPGWAKLSGALKDQEERPAQVLKLRPTGRSRLR